MSKIITSISALALVLLLAEPSGKSAELHIDTKKQLIKLVRNFANKASKKDAEEIASAILGATHKAGCEVSWDMLLSVAIQESGLNKRAFNDDTQDYGIMQLNAETIERLNLDKGRVQRDLAYSFYHGCKILTQNKTTYSESVPFWIGIYNAGVRLSSPTVVKHAKSYDKSIRAIMGKIKRDNEKLYAAYN